MLEVSTWHSPFTSRVSKRVVASVDVPDRKPPAWWHGDEEASQGFLQAMGVKL